MTPETPQKPIDEPSAGKLRGNRFSLLSHDLRSALSDVMGGLRLIDGERLDPENKAHFERVSAASEALVRLFEKSVADDGEMQPDRLTQASNIMLTDFLEDVRRRWRDHADEKGIAFEVETEENLPAILTLDRVSLDRVIANLVGNSVKFTDEGRVTLSVQCMDDRALVFRITDTGPGLSEAAQACLFEYGGRPPETDKPGTGLGLYIAKELSAVLDAELKVANRSEGGVEALLRIPHAAWFDRSLRRNGNAEQKPGAAVDLSGLRILLAEDNKTNQLVATQMLGAMGAEYSVASDGLEALELIQAEHFDLALLDIEMPRMSGLELIRAVRAMPAPTSEMPLVALTAYVMREHRERIYAAGAEGIIAKPLMSIEELGQAVLDYYNGTKSRIGKVVTHSEEAEQETEEVVNRQVFDNLVETIGSESTAELLSKLQADTDSVAEGLGRGRQNLDLVLIRSQTHILISVAGAIGAARVQNLAQKLNSAANRKEAAEIDGLCRECLSGLADLQAFILDEQAKIAPAV